MNLRERREPLDHMETLLRHSLRERTAHQGPLPKVRDSLMQRAAAQRRVGLGWRLPFSLTGLFSGNAFRLTIAGSYNQVPNFEAFFGPRLSWYTINQLMR